MKKLLSMIMAICMLLTVCAGAVAEGTVTLKVWGAQEDQVMLGEMVDAFKAANPDKTYDITFGVVGEPDAKARFLEDPSAAADVFAFPDDQLLEFVATESLYEVIVNLDGLQAANGEGAVAAATVDGTVYAYPMTADNGYFMYYDKSIFSEEDVQSFNQMLNVADEAGKKVFMDVSNGWYIASFFFGAGCTLTLNDDATQNCDFNGPNGLAAAEGIRAIVEHNAFITGDDAVLTGGMGDNVAAGVSGTWNAGIIQEKLGDNYAACKLPAFLCGGELKQMGSFAGFKMMGVNKYTEFPEDAQMLADFLTNEENQIKRFETRQLGPANINAANSDAVKADIALSALAAQAPFSTSQQYVNNNTYWTPAEALGLALENKEAGDLQTALDAMVAQITAK